MVQYSNWLELFINPLVQVLQATIQFLPKLIGAFLVFLFGIFVGELVKKIVAGFLRKLRLDQFFESTRWKEAFEKADIKTNISDFIGEICKWILIIAFLSASVEVLGFVRFAEFLERVVSWLPNLVIGVVIFVVAVIIADILEKIIKASAKRLGVKLASFLGSALKIVIYVIAVLTILLEWGIGEEIIQPLIMGIIFGLSLAFGLAFGLGGKELAKDLLEEVRKKITEK